MWPSWPTGSAASRTAPSCARAASCGPAGRGATESLLMPHALFLDELISTLGAEVAQRGDDVPARYHTDWSGTPPQRPLALVRPRSTDEVSALMRLCTAHRVPVVPQGGLTGTAGAAVPVAGAVAVSLERMRSGEHTAELPSQSKILCRLFL